MADSFKPILKGIIAALKANGTISAIVGTRVYSNVPQNATFPYMTVRISSQPFDSKEDTGMIHTVEVNGYSRKDSPAEAGDMRAGAYNLLNRGESNITLDSGTLVSMLYSGLGDVLLEPDGITYRSIIRFTAIVD